MTQQPRQILEKLWQQGVAAVEGERVVATSLASDRFAPDAIAAVGKSAIAMYRGALSRLENDIPALIVTKSACNAQFGPAVTIIEAGHPVPDAESLRAGRELLEFVSGLPAGSRLLMLVSGGASALVEHAAKGVSLADLQEMNRELVASGATIAAINEMRCSVSRIKGGRLLSRFAGARVLTYAISDVQGDDIAVIGSGIGNTRAASVFAQQRIVASNKIARNAIGSNASMRVADNAETLYGDVMDVAQQFAKDLLSGKAGLYIRGGEPTIALPESPGVGGRNLSLALALAINLQGATGMSVLVAGTDGDDGNSGVAGAVVNGATVDDPETAGAALKRADAFTYLSERGAIFDSGDTGTNVMDIAIAIVGGAELP